MGDDSGSGDSEHFEESEWWELSATEMVPEGPQKPYLQFNCPRCNTPNAFGYGVSKRDMPVDCVECGEPMRLRVAIEVVGNSSTGSDGDGN